MAQHDGRPGRIPGLLKYFRPDLFGPRHGVLQVIGSDGEGQLSPEAAEQWHEALALGDRWIYMTRKRLTKEHAEDIWQIVLLAVWRALKERGPVDRISGYVRVVHDREVARYVERMKEHTLTVLGQDVQLGAEDDTHVPHNLADLHERARRLAKELEGLVTPAQAEAVILVDAYGLDSKFVAELTGTTHAVVRNRASRARREMRKPEVRKQVHTRLGVTD
ncbi:RNA polymerase sigma factor [Streptomyces sp. NPDC002913]